jgi:hypothetical protein
MFGFKFSIKFGIISRITNAKLKVSVTTSDGNKTRLKALSRYIKPDILNGYKHGPGRTPGSNSAGHIYLAMGGIYYRCDCRLSG